MTSGSPPITIPDRLNMAEWFLDARLDEGLGDKTAVYYPGQSVGRGSDPARELSYADLVGESCRVTNLLRELGLGIEDRVLLLMPDTPAFVACYFGVLRAGCVAVPANNWLTAKDYAYYLEYARPKAVIVDAEIWAHVDEARKSEGRHTKHFIVDDRTGAPAPAGTVDFRKATAALPSTAQTEPTYRDDFATWLSSSGSTGNPKCVVHMHHDFVWNTIAYAQRTLGLKRSDRTLSAPKLFFGYALGSNVLFPFSVGASCVLFPERSTPDTLFAVIARHRPTVLINVPTMVQQMVAHPAAGAQDLRSLRLATSAGEALPAELYARWQERFRVELLDGLGTAEMWHIFISNRPGQVVPGTLGQVVPGFEVKLCDGDGREVPRGEVGALWVKGDSRAIAYWQRMQDTMHAFRGEWYVSGDMLRQNPDGTFVYCGRADDMLKVSGKWLSPGELENCLLQHEQVREVAVVGVKNADGLVKPCAFVVSDAASPSLAAALQAFAKSRLEPYKYPREVVFVESLPRTHLGKVDRHALSRSLQVKAE